jgi:hypothetical protein
MSPLASYRVAGYLTFASVNKNIIMAKRVLRPHRRGWSPRRTPASPVVAVPRVFLLSRTLSSCLLATGLSALMVAPAAADDCPTAQSGKRGFVVERGDQQKSEVFHEDDGIVFSVMRYNRTILLERVQYEGLFELNRIDRGVLAKFEPQIDLKAFFPLKLGHNIEAKFTSESNGQHGTLLVQMMVKGAPCQRIPEEQWRHGNDQI